MATCACNNNCTGGCKVGCTNCTGCYGGCTSCTWCGGQGTCFGGCSSGCAWTCSGGCSGCSGGCSDSCSGGCKGDCKTGCTNSCKGLCNTGCDSSAMSITLEDYLTSENIQEIADLIIFELSRRPNSAAPTNTTGLFADGKEITLNDITTIVENLKLTG